MQNDNALENFDITEVQLEAGDVMGRNPELVAGRVARQQIVNTYFAR